MRSSSDKNRTEAARLGPSPKPLGLYVAGQMVRTGQDSHVGYLEADEQYYHGLSQNQAGSNRTHRDGPCYMLEPDAALPPKAANCRFDMWEDAAQVSHANTQQTSCQSLPCLVDLPDPAWHPCRAGRS